MISVITPCKNVISEGRLPFFRKMFETLYAQTYRDFEHIVVDAGSEDGTREILAKYQERGLIDTIISEKDRNVHEAMNKGLKLAKGEFIHVMNSDNYFTTPLFFERSLEALKKYDADFTHGDRSIVHRDGRPTTIKQGDERMAFFRMPFRYQTMLIRKTVYDEIGPFDERFMIASDLKFMMHMLLAKKKGIYFPEVFICSLDGGNTRDRKKCIEEVTQVLYEEYGLQYGLSGEECQSIYMRQISPTLWRKLQSNVKNEQILRSLEYCYIHSRALDDVPLEQNYSKGLFQVEIPEFGPPERGKVRESWQVQRNGKAYRVMITTDRLAVNAHPICLIPGKGQIANLISAYWFERTQDIVPNHMIAVPHPNVLIARPAKTMIPIEMVVRRYLARSSNPASVYHQYFAQGKRLINGISFPDGMTPNQELPMGTMVTPTTKARDGHDVELTHAEAQKITEEIGGKGLWDTIRKASIDLFERARLDCLEKGLILADTKFEFGVDAEGKIMLVDEALTPECSRYWLAKNYTQHMHAGLDPDPPKNGLIDYLEKNEFAWDGHVPLIPEPVIDTAREAYALPYRMITGKELPPPETDYIVVANAAVEAVKKIGMNHFLPKESSMQWTK